jgi:hypothetical protein
MRQTSPISRDDYTGNPILLNNNIKSVSPGITCRPAKWLVRRDTDFVPFELGFNAFIENTTYANQTVPAGALTYYNVAVPSNATSIKIRLMKPGTVPGWKAGVFQYGDALPEQLAILVKQYDYPSATSFDFKTINNAVSIPTDGGAGYLANILNGGFEFAVQNNTDSAVDFDCYVELDWGTPTRVYFPPIGECFSYDLDGTPGVYFQYMGNSYGDLASKPIPQMGYCLFKVRATRLPTDNGKGVAVTPATGPALTMKVGQNMLVNGVMTFTPFKAADGVSNLTVTIPANAGTSDDVKVFIPVLGGNEVVYQCSQQVIFDAWANFQPIFFNQQFGKGQFPYDPDYNFEVPTPTVYQYCLNFINDFNVGIAGWPLKYSNNGSQNITGSVVQFPLFRELYDDLVSLLTLLGGKLPSGNQTGGAGGTGGAGDLFPGGNQL